MTVWRQTRKDIADLRRIGAIVTVVAFDHRDYETVWRWVRRQRGYTGDRTAQPAALEWLTPQGDPIVICPVVWPSDEVGY